MKIMKITIMIICILVICQKVHSYDIAESFQYPVDDYLIKKGNNDFGACGYVKSCPTSELRDPDYYGYHLGEDIGVVAETSVKAPANGIVRDAYKSSSYGGIYLIEHYTGLEYVVSVIAHLNYDTFTKKKGDTVQKNEYLGQIGTTAQNGGWGEHLHYQIIKGLNINTKRYYSHYGGDSWIWQTAYLGYSKDANLTETTKINYDRSHETMLNDFYNPTYFINLHSSLSSPAPNPPVNLMIE